MTDPFLFAIGCGVTFLFLAGAYIVVRAENHAVRKRAVEAPSTSVAA